MTDPDHSLVMDLLRGGGRSERINPPGSIGSLLPQWCFPAVHWASKNSKAPERAKISTLYPSNQRTLSSPTQYTHSALGDGHAVRKSPFSRFPLVNVRTTWWKGSKQWSRKQWAWSEWSELSNVPIPGTNLSLQIAHINSVAPIANQKLVVGFGQQKDTEQKDDECPTKKS